MGFAKDQRGAINLGMLYLVISLVFFVMLGFKLLPMYLDNIFIQDGLKNLTLEKVKSSSKAEIREDLKKYFRINNIRGDFIDNISVTRKDGQMLVTMDYTRQTTLFANIDLVVSFQNHWSSKNPEECCSPIDSE